MQFIKNSSKSATEVVEAIKVIAPNHKFGVLSVRDMKETLASKGFELNEECYIIDICNPGVAQTLLSEDLALSSVLPCKISVCAKNGETMVVMADLTSLVKDINPNFTDIATTTQATLQNIIEEAV